MSTYKQKYTSNKSIGRYNRFSHKVMPSSKPEAMGNTEKKAKTQTQNALCNKNLEIFILFSYSRNSTTIIRLLETRFEARMRNHFSLKGEQKYYTYCQP